jgi:hypothetical protein
MSGSRLPSLVSSSRSSKSSLRSGSHETWEQWEGEGGSEIVKPATARMHSMNAVWRRGRLFFRCPACQGRVTRLYVPIAGRQPRCRRCWGLSYESQSWSYKATGMLAFLGPAAHVTTLERRERSRLRLGCHIALGFPSSDHGTSGASGNTKTNESDQGLASSRNRSPLTTSPALARPVAT